MTKGNTVLLIVFTLLTMLTWSLHAAEIYQDTALPSDEVLERNLTNSINRALSGRGVRYTCQLVGKRQLANDEHEVYFNASGQGGGSFRARLVKLDNNKWFLIAVTTPFGNEVVGTMWLVEK